LNQENEEPSIGGDILQILAGTVVEISEEEVLFVAQLDLSAETFGRTFEEWLASDQLNKVYRLVGIGDDVAVGTEIQISIAIMTKSLPPLAPVVSYEIIN